jgi:hypothetical protein
MKSNTFKLLGFAVLSLALQATRASAANIIPELEALLRKLPEEQAASERANFEKLDTATQKKMVEVIEQVMKGTQKAVYGEVVPERTVFVSLEQVDARIAELDKEIAKTKEERIAGSRAMLDLDPARDAAKFRAATNQQLVKTIQQSELEALQQLLPEFKKLVASKPVIQQTEIVQNYTKGMIGDVRVVDIRELRDFVFKREIQVAGKPTTFAQLNDIMFVAKAQLGEQGEVLGHLESSFFEMNQYTRSNVSGVARLFGARLFGYVGAIAVAMATLSDYNSVRAAEIEAGRPTLKNQDSVSGSSVEYFDER